MTEREQEIIRLIGEVRAEYHSCTAAEVATRLGISRAYISELMHEMKSKGMVTWVDDVIGSVIALVDEHGEPTGVARVSSCATCGWPDDKALTGHVRAKHGAAHAASPR